jgi:hypothetical protein
VERDNFRANNIDFGAITVAGTFVDIYVVKLLAAATWINIKFKWST